MDAFGSCCHKYQTRKVLYQLFIHGIYWKMIVSPNSWIICRIQFHHWMRTFCWTVDHGFLKCEFIERIKWKRCISFSNAIHYQTEPLNWTPLIYALLDDGIRWWYSVLTLSALHFHISKFVIDQLSRMAVINGEIGFAGEFHSQNFVIDSF